MKLTKLFAAMACVITLVSFSGSTSAQVTDGTWTAESSEKHEVSQQVKAKIMQTKNGDFRLVLPITDIIFDLLEDGATIEIDKDGLSIVAEDGFGF